MAASKVAGVGMLSFKVTYYNRIAFRSLKQTIRACHISVQEPAPSLAEPVRSEFSIPPPTIGRSAKATRNRLLSHGLSSAGTVQPLGTLRTYSVLPQRELYTTPYLQVDESASCSASNRKCWKCGRETDGLKELFFCHCGVVQSPAAELTFFTLFNVEESFDVDVKKLSEVYKDLQKHLHPDKYSQQSEMEQSLAEQQSSLLNKAYFTLLKPLPRALYLLELQGYVIEEDSTELNAEFLMEVLDLNERIGEGSLDDVHEIEAEIQSKIEENIKGLALAFAARDYAAAKESTVRLRYYVNVESKVKTFFRDRM